MTPYDIISEVGYKALLNTDSIGRYKAVQAFYDSGHITEEEAKALEDCDWVSRNDCTTLFISDSGDKFILTCYENLYVLFELSFNINSGVTETYCVEDEFKLCKGAKFAICKPDELYKIKGGATASVNCKCWLTDA